MAKSDLDKMADNIINKDVKTIEELSDEINKVKEILKDILLKLKTRNF